ncbi:UPF0738 family protein [Alkalicoccobacillus murimartini]|uniref:Uncharacterized protein n=1 Tax=Alkalicoccobacillus murimartini TaxID=171685 RepID=A0ABT9YJU7_9BACI|nr:hypothetical protein [Alkalicoccobacillus murimartini]MDQ0207883.1 hypothetical protein [Alkalicoccobacillus murimartini]
MHKLHIIELTDNGDHWLAKGHEKLSEDLAKTLEPGKRLLVDSDGFAFIYILEDESGFHQVIFHQELWSQVREAYETKKAIHLDLHDNVHIELSHFHDEFDFLLENIQGNGNYGEDFEQAVNVAFKEK